jgi:hypothetical protein
MPRPLDLQATLKNGHWLVSTGRVSKTVALSTTLSRLWGKSVFDDFKELALRGDVHKHNIAVLGLANKAAAKKFYYTLMMGGQGKRLAADQAQFGTKMTAKEGTAPP